MKKNKKENTYTTDYIDSTAFQNRIYLTEELKIADTAFKIQDIINGNYATYNICDDICRYVEPIKTETQIREEVAKDIEDTIRAELCQEIEYAMRMYEKYGIEMTHKQLRYVLKNIINCGKLYPYNDTNKKNRRNK